MYYVPDFSDHICPFTGQDLLIHVKRYQGSKQLMVDITVLSYNFKGSCTLKAP